MQVFELKPTSKDAPDWEASTYRGVVIVRATDEDHARDLANEEFIIGTKKGTDTLHPPWRQSSLVACRNLRRDQRFDTEGPAGILLGDDREAFEKLDKLDLDSILENRRDVSLVARRTTLGIAAKEASQRGTDYSEPFYLPVTPPHIHTARVGAQLSGIEGRWDQFDLKVRQSGGIVWLREIDPETFEVDVRFARPKNQGKAAQDGTVTETV